MSETTNPTIPFVLTVADAAELLAVDEKTIRKLLAEGTLKGAKVGRHWRVVGASVEALLGISAAPAAAPPPPPTFPDTIPRCGRPGRAPKQRRRSASDAA